MTAAPNVPANVCMKCAYMAEHGAPLQKLTVCIRNPPTALMIPHQGRRGETVFTLSSAYPPVNASTLSCGSYMPDTVFSKGQPT